MTEIIMRVIHIVPTAYEYFTDISENAFKIVEKLNERGIESEAFTLQFASPTRKEKAAIKSTAPSRAFMGMNTLNEMVASLNAFDLVHLHCPFLGAARKLLDWKKIHTDIPMVITYHRRVLITDIISLFIKGYNAYFLPKIFSSADAITSWTAGYFKSERGFSYLNDKSKFYYLAKEGDIQLLKEFEVFDRMITRLVDIYSVLTKE